MSFKDIYPLEDFASIADVAWWRANDFDTRSNGGDFDRDAYQIAHEADKADQERYRAHKDLFRERIQIHLDGLLSTDALQPITGIGGRDISFANAWNAYVAGEEGNKYERIWMLDAFNNVLTHHFVKMDEGRYGRKREEGHVAGTHVIPTEDQVHAAWEALCEDLDQGTGGFTWHIEVNDNNTGERCHIDFENWVARVMRYNDKYELVEVQDVAELTLITAEFNVPTGKLLLTDVLRLESFKKGTEFGSDREYREFSLNSAAGRTARITGHAAEHNMAYTQTTNTSVAVYRDKAGQLMVTERWFSEEWPEDEKGHSIIEGWEFVGDFSCDVWCVNAFDRATAIDLMKAGGSDCAEEELDRYLAMATAKTKPDDRQAGFDACYARNIVQLDVEPGRWQIHAGEDFSAKVDRKKFAIPEGVEPWCILTKAA